MADRWKGTYGKSRRFSMPNEVLTLIANKMKSPVMSQWKAFFDKIDKCGEWIYHSDFRILLNTQHIEMTGLAYVPSQPIMSRHDWPTLRELISQGKHIVVFYGQRT